MCPETFAQTGVSSFPNLCCYCGKPATHTLPLDARIKRTRYFVFAGYREVTLRYGSVFPTPYCRAHYEEAVKVRDRIRAYWEVNSTAGIVLIACCVTLAVLKLDIATAPGDPVWWSYVMRGFAGILLGGLLAFPFEPFFRDLTGILFPLFLSFTTRADLRAHLRAQGENWYRGQIAYLPGISVKYNSLEEFRQSLIKRAIFATDPCFASATPSVLGIRALPKGDKKANRNSFAQVEGVNSAIHQSNAKYDHEEHRIALSWHSLFLSPDGSSVIAESGPFMPWGRVRLSAGNWTWVLFAVGDTGKEYRDERGEPYSLLAVVDMLCFSLPLESDYSGKVIELENRVHGRISLNEAQRLSIKHWFEGPASGTWGSHWQRRHSRVREIVI